MARMDIPNPPDDVDIAKIRRRARTAKDPLERFSIDLKTTTPIFGGGVEGGKPDEEMPIRVPSIRGHLRFWWRALQPPGMTPKEMLSREQAIFGGAAGNEGKASRVIVSVANVQTAGLDDNEPSLATADGYALFPARKEKGESDVKPRWKPGLKFTLTVDVPIDEADAVRNALRAWILFGGYGGRTRRGCGSLECANENDRDLWLPREPTAAAIQALLGADVFSNATATPPDDTPRLAGATILAGQSGSSHNAWLSAVGLLKTFRQGERVARDPGSQNRPGRSRWPEADKARRLVQRPTAHTPRHNETPAWPRAAFGLPIIAGFQQQPRPDQTYPHSEPKEFRLSWIDSTGEPHDRLASPLILKPLALANGSFAPIALWLNRAFPAGEVVAKVTDGRDGRVITAPATAAPFGRVVADGDTVLFEPMQGHASVRAAFLHWVKAQQNWSLASGAIPR